jgi:homoserine dehydrogenase
MSRLVLKFGSSVLRSEEDLPAAVHEIYRHVRRGHRLVVVVSAFGSTTDRLLERARVWHDGAAPEALAALLATGEATSAALLTLALERAGVPVALVDAHRLGIETEGPLLDALPVALTIDTLESTLVQHPVVVVPGFVGRDRASGRLTLLGRGGSDLTAVFLAAHLGPERLVLVKDVPGIFDHDPATGGARCYATLTWDQALAVGGRVIQPKALQVARDHRLPIEVTALSGNGTTVIGPSPARFAEEGAPAPRLAVTLLGLGTVGGGVVARLLALPDRFHIARVLVRDPSRLRHPGLDPALLTNHPEDALAAPCDVVVELLGGLSPAEELTARALAAGRSVVTANKALVAARGPELEELAARSGARYLYSASVGGALPALEAVSTGTPRLTSLQAVINGTTNFVLEALHRGRELAEAIREAQEQGFAEADPTLDLTGVDAAQQLAILTRRGFGVSLAAEEIPTEGILELTPHHAETARAHRRRLRLLATARRVDGRVDARVRVVELPEDHPLAQLGGAANGLLLRYADGPPRFLTGTGAGRWPTTEAVMADLLDLHHDETRQPAPWAAVEATP